MLSATPLALSAADGQWLTGTGNGVFASADRGQTWSPFGTLSAFVTDLAASPAITTDHTLFVTTSCAGCAGMNIRRTTDGGATWQIVRSINGSGALAISPNMPLITPCMPSAVECCDRATAGTAGTRSGRGRPSANFIG
jgi:hypothetical protein